MENIDKIKELIDKGDLNGALTLCDKLLEDAQTGNKDYIYYLKGNAYRKEENWQKALDNYQYAIDLNPSSPAVTSRKMIIDILNYYYKEQFNQ